MKEEVTELDQRLFLHTVNKLNNKFHTVEDFVKFWRLFGPCIERCPTPEIRRPWMSGLDLDK